jgi:hypothetical protein
VPEGLVWELIVVNNCCDDDTSEVVRSFLARLPLREIFEPVPGLGHARNTAIREARGRYILWCDDDVVVDERWLAAFVVATRVHPDAAVFGGTIEPYFPVEPDPILVEAFPALANGFCGLDADHHHASGGMVWGANMGLRKADLHGLAFDPALGHAPGSLRGSDDVVMIQQLKARGKQVAWCPEMKVTHYVSPERVTLSYLTAYYAAVGETYVYTDGVPGGPRLLGVPRWLLRRWLELRVQSWGCRLGGRRVASLVALRQLAVFTGVIRACRRARPSRLHAGVPLDGCVGAASSSSSGSSSSNPPDLKVEPTEAQIPGVKRSPLADHFTRSTDDLR